MGTEIVNEAKAAVDAFSKKTLAGMIEGLHDIYNLIFAIKGGLSKCATIPGDMEKIAEILASFSNPVTLAWHIGKDLVVNGVSIYREIMDSVTQFNKGNFEEFGKDIGKASASLILGAEKPLI